MSDYTEFDLPYGNSLLKAKIPAANIAYTLETCENEGIADEYEAIAESLRNPIESAPLIDHLKPDDKVVVLVTDNTRACPDDRKHIGRGQRHTLIQICLIKHPEP